MMKKSYLAILGILTTVSFWNCSFLPGGFESVGYTTLSSSLPLNHPELTIETNEEVSFKPQLMSRFQVYSHLQAIINSPSLTPPFKDYIDNVLNAEILGNPSLFGGSCDLANPLNLTVIAQDCQSNVTNATVEEFRETSISREASRVQACRRSVGYDEIIVAFRNRVQTSVGAPSIDPTFQSIAAIHQMFFPGQELDPEFVAMLLSLYDDMGRNLETQNDRWRMLFLVFCEMPDWQYI